MYANGETDMKFNAIIHKCEPPETGYWAEVPSLPGCVTEGETLEEVNEMLAEAVDVWIATQNDIAERKVKQSQEKVGLLECLSLVNA